MADTASELKSEINLQALTEALESGTMQHARRILNGLHPAEIAHLLESLPPQQRNIVWQLVDSENHGEVLVEVGDEVRARLIQELDADTFSAAIKGLDMDDLADLLQDLPDAVIRQALDGMDYQYRRRLETVMSYDEDSAGGLMNTDTITVRADVTLDVVIRYLRMRGEIPELTDSLVVVNRYDVYLGILPLTTILTQDENMTVAKVMERDIEGIQADVSADEVARIFEDLDLVSSPVVDGNGKLLGRITIDDVVDVIRDQAEHSLMSMAGLDEEEDIFAPVAPSARRRAVWLGVNLLTAFIAAWAIGLFQGAIEKIVALAVLMPIVASMGGIAGSQTLTLVIRGLALGQVGRSNARYLLSKELAVGALNGLIWALVVALIAALWFKDVQLGAIIAAAMVINLLCASLAGVSIPLMLRRMQIDPALAGGVILTTVTDVVGFVAFLGLATVLLL
ncbi:MAG: magnesium transporter [Gammaproteobacteria bacterium]